MSRGKEVANQVILVIDEQGEMLQQIVNAGKIFVDTTIEKLGDVITEIEYEDLPEILAVVIDEKTNTGKFESVDGPAIKILAGFLLKKFLSKDDFEVSKSKALLGLS